MAGVLLVAGCGDDDGPAFTGSDEEQVAATVNAMTEAIAAGDGDGACELMTERGQRALVRAVGTVPGVTGTEICADAVPILAENGYDPGDFRMLPGDVSPDPDNRDHMWAQCDLRGAFLALGTDDGWRVDIPFCAD